MKVYRDIRDENTGALIRTEEVFDIMECTYSGKDMGERSVTATIKYATPIAFEIGDYIVLEMQDLKKTDVQGTNKLNGGVFFEKFYIYGMPTIKKTARPMSVGDAFEHTVVFYPIQHELSGMMMRDCLQESANTQTIIFTQLDEVTFYGGAAELMQRIQAVLDDVYMRDPKKNRKWEVNLAPGIDENNNDALERFAFSFSGNTVMDALLKLNDKEGINTTFFINEEGGKGIIYVGYNRPYLCKADTTGATDPAGVPLKLMYGKTSHEGLELDHGGLFDITKSVGKENPITRLYVKGADRNLNRYYCSDRIKSGRYVRNLMIPQFDIDGRTNYIESPEGIKRFGVCEGSKTFDDIYPSLRYMTTGDLRTVKYVLKVKSSGLDPNKYDEDGKLLPVEKSNDEKIYPYPIARVQCYRVEENPDKPGFNRLVEAYPDQPIAVSVHARGKVVRTVLYTSLAEQKEHDMFVPHTDAYDSKDDSKAIVGSCFLVHDPKFDSASDQSQYLVGRAIWFLRDFETKHLENGQKIKDEITNHRIEYVDTFWFTDLYIFDKDAIETKTIGRIEYTEYAQKYFPRDGYSAYCWPRTNTDSGIPDETVVNEIVAVQPIVREDTSLTISEGTYEKTFDVYLKDVGFAFDEQNDFGDMVFVFDDVKLSFLDGNLEGREYSFKVPNQANVNAICAYRYDGTLNEDFLDLAHDRDFAQQALADGAFWRVTCIRQMEEESIGLMLPMNGINAESGDHVVFLDLYMPDIYIRAAEDRLLIEAQKYLDANDKGKVSYAVNFDKVRIQQVQCYALQLREGVRLRMVDDDLNITSENRVTEIYKDEQGMSPNKLFSHLGKVYSQFNMPVRMEADKYYRIQIDIMSTIADLTTSVLALRTSTGEVYIPTILHTDVSTQTRPGFRRLTIEFATESSFNDNHIYYIALGNSNGTIDAMKLLYVAMQNTQGEGNVLPYVDFTADSVTIKITDNTRIEEGRRPQPIREVQATLSESTIASALASYRNDIKETKNEVDGLLTSYNNIVSEARRHYRELLSLRWSIFDPDADTDNPCDKVFVHYMMMQVGADSMNYLLHKTKKRPDGRQINFTLGRNEGETVDTFSVQDTDRLDHYIYTQGSQQGTWQIPGGFSAQLTSTTNDKGETVWPVYYICIRCRKDSDNILTEPAWIVSTKQYAVNDKEDENFWYFNWGILTSEQNDGHYSLMETRGSAYMYGDNLVCGRIQSMGGNSWFDLDTGNFHLGRGGQEALSYVDGILKIAGINDQDPTSVLERLKVIEKKDEEWSWMAYYVYTHEAFGTQRGINVPFVAPKKLPAGVYKISCGPIVIKAYDRDEEEHDVAVGRIAVNIGSGTIDVNQYDNGIVDYIEVDDNAQPRLLVFFGDTTGLPQIEKFKVWIPYLSCKKVEHNYQYEHYLEKALKGSTEIAGGLTMTNLLMLKDEEGNVSSGMSGLNDGITMWAGGTYQEAYAQAHTALEQLVKALPVLITQSGIGSKIGPFEIISNNAVRVRYSNDEYIEIDTTTGIKVHGEKDGVESDIFIQPSGEINLFRDRDLKVKITNDKVDSVSLDEDSYITVIGSDGFKSGKKEEFVYIGDLPLSTGEIEFTCRYKKVEMHMRGDLFSVKEINSNHGISIYPDNELMGPGGVQFHVDYYNANLLPGTVYKESDGTLKVKI